MVGEILLSGINHAICKDYIRDKVLYPFDNLSGILLTPELLKKCGFVENPVDYFSIQSMPQLEFLNQGVDFKVFNSDSTILCFVKYLHELQNLHYLITKEELIVNL